MPFSGAMPVVFGEDESEVGVDLAALIRSWYGVIPSALIG